MTELIRSKTDNRRHGLFSAGAKTETGISYAVLVCVCFLLVLSGVSGASAGQRSDGLTSPEFRKAMTLYDEGATDKALQMMKDVVKNEPKNPYAYEKMGYMLLKKRDLDNALSAFRSALRINPLMRTSRTGVGITLYEKGDLDGAEKALTKALSLNPYPSRAHYALGLVYEARKDYKKSIGEFKEGLRTFVPGKQ